MESNEFDIALGAIPEIFGKSTGPETTGVAFVVAASHAPNYVHNDTLDKMKNIAYDGVPFHALWFVRNKEYSDIYKTVLRAVLEYRAQRGLDGARSMLAEYTRIESMRNA